MTDKDIRKRAQPVGLNYSERLRQYAREKGLEEYLQDPERLHRQIREMNLLLYQMQKEIHDNGRRDNVGTSPDTLSFMKLYPIGKFVLHYLPLENYEEEAVEAFRRAAISYATVDVDSFIKHMKSQNAPDDVIHEYLKYYYIRDDSYVALEPFYSGQ